MLIDGARYRWSIEAADPDLVSAIQRSAGLTAATAEALVRRGVGSADEAQRLLSPDIRDLPDVQLLPDVDKMVARVRRALEVGERITVHGHDDADGVTASIVMVDALRELGGEVGVYIPDRRTEGHGLNTVELDGLAASGTTLLITVDSCVSEVENIAYAASLGIDVIVTDHHEIPPVLPAAVAIINAKLPDSPYPYRYMAGAGLAWRLAGHLLEEFADKRTAAPPWGGERWMDEALPLAAIGSIADRVPLTGDNRVLITEGLRVLPQTVRPGLRALLEASNLSGRALSYDDVQENIGSIFGRVSDGKGTNRAYEMLAEEDPEAAASIARELADARQEWRSTANRAWKIVERVASELPADSPVLIVEAAVPIEVMGSATSRLAEKTGKPCLLIMKKNGEAHAEARGPAGYNFVVAFQSMGELFLGYGGHPRAAGFSIESDRVDEFRARMEAHAAEHPPVPVPRVVDAELPLSDATLTTAVELAGFAPFGQGWGRPVLLARGVTREAVAAVEQNGLRFRTPMRVADGPVDLFYRLSVADEVLFASEVDRAPGDAGAAAGAGSSADAADGGLTDTAADTASWEA